MKSIMFSLLAFLYAKQPQQQTEQRPSTSHNATFRVSTTTTHLRQPLAPAQYYVVNGDTLVVKH